MVNNYCKEEIAQINTLGTKLNPNFEKLFHIEKLPESENILTIKEKNKLIGFIHYSRIYECLEIQNTVGRICSEFVMCYPPGIPILAPGERITSDILSYIEYAKLKGCSMTGPEDSEIKHLNVLKGDD